MAHAWNLSGMVVESDCQMLINLLYLRPDLKGTGEFKPSLMLSYVLAANFDVSFQWCNRAGVPIGLPTSLALCPFPISL